MNKLRIVSGRFKGVGLEMPKKQSTRPTKSILKESFFNSVGGFITHSVFVECFGGSGSMGCEALSRGASEAIFIERDSECFEVLKSNIEKLNKLDSSIISRVYYGDTFEVLEGVLDGISHRAILYLDPPFCIRDGMDGIYQRCFELVEKIKNKNIKLIAFEHFSSFEMPQNIGYFSIIKTKKFGKSSLSYFASEEE